MKNQENDPQKLQSNQENDLQQQPPPEEPEEEKPHLQELRQQNHPISAPPIMASIISSPPPKPPPKPPSPRSDSPLDSTHSFDHSSYGYVFSPPEVKQATYHSPPLDHTSHSYVVSSPDVKPAKPPSPPSPPAEAPAPVSKVGSKTQDEEVVKPVEDGIGGGGGGIKRRPKVSISERKRENIKRRALLGFRIFGFVFCLVSFSVMAADKNQGWALDSFYRYKEFRYCMSVNVIGFAYSALQSYDLAYSLATGKFVARNQLRFYLDFSLDQMLTYLLLSASSSAAFRVEDWESNWGNDKFPAMARSSVVLSFLAFVAFALSSLVSSHTLFTPKSM